ncbi:MAG TPA: phosphopantetheine-binding protein [Caulobacteraceae bacterium]|nr:phosphopantetheine-binding protein [Caulobacteraceae bacterium]
MASQDEELFDLIAQEALIDRGKLTREATLADLGLDSVDIVTVVFAVEERYQVEVPQDAFDGVTDLGGFVDTLGTLIAPKIA